MWILKGELNHKFFSVTRLTQESAIAERERRLKPQRVKDPTSPTGYRTHQQNGWTAITRQKER